MSVENSVVAIYHTHTDADRAVKELQRGGVDMHKLSIVGKGYHTDGLFTIPAKSDAMIGHQSPPYDL